MILLRTYHEGYSQLIVGSGPTDIGIHQDVYGPSKIPVDTYFTMCAGAKQVFQILCVFIQ